MKQHNALLKVLWITIAASTASGVCPATEYYVRGDNSIRLQSTADLLQVQGPTIRMDGTSSPSGLMCYLQKSLDYSKAFFEPYAFSSGVDDGVIPSRAYEPDLVVMYLHIITSNGEDVKSLPIRQRYGTPVSEGVFHGDRFVVLKFKTRMGGVLQTRIADIDTGRVLSLSRSPETGFANVSVSPDGQKIVIITRNRLYLDGLQIYPYFERQPLCDSMSPTEYEAKAYEIKEWLTSNPRFLEFVPLNNAVAWSPDSKYVGMLAHGKAGSARTEVLGHDLRIVAVNTMNVDSHRTSQEYLTEIPVSATNPIDLPSSRVIWNATNESISIQAYHDKQASHDVIIPLGSRLPSSATGE